MGGRIINEFCQKVAFKQKRISFYEGMAFFSLGDSKASRRWQKGSRRVVL
jgi:hypothetical protein